MRRSCSSARTSRPGGAERQWATLVPGLAELGFDVGVITLDGRGVYFEELRARAGSRSPAPACGTGPIPVGLARVVRLAGRRSSAVVTRGVSAHLVGQVLARRQRAAHVATEHLGPDPLGMRPYRRHQRLLLAADAAAGDGGRRRRGEPDGASRATTATGRTRSG